MHHITKCSVATLLGSKVDWFLVFTHFGSPQVISRTLALLGFYKSHFVFLNPGADPGPQEEGRVLKEIIVREVCVKSFGHAHINCPEQDKQPENMREVN